MYSLMYNIVVAVVRIWPRGQIKGTNIYFFFYRASVCRSTDNTKVIATPIFSHILLFLSFASY